MPRALLLLLLACGDAASTKGGGAVDEDIDDDGYTEAQGDCNDHDPATNPAAAEACDSVDNNCDGAVDEGVASVWYPDADGDGFGDANNAITACSSVDGAVPNAEDCDDSSAATFPGATELCDGVDNDCDALPDPNSCRPLETAEGRIHGLQPDDTLGHIVAAAGDLNGDGRMDLALGAPGYDPAGAAYFFTALVDGDQAASAAAATFIGGNPGDDAGYSLAGVGDINQDGFPDVAIGARNNPTGGSAAGAVFLLAGPVTGLYSEAQAMAVLIGEDADDSAGISLSPAGDTDGDGVAELLVGAPNVENYGISSGAAYLVSGLLYGEIDLELATARIYGSAEGEYTGQRVADLGDLDGDGFDDFAVSAPSSDLGSPSAGAVALFHGPLTGDHTFADAAAVLTGTGGGDHAGTSVAGPGDLDGDGKDDVLVGAPDQSDGGTGAGAAYLVTGDPRGPLPLSAAAATLYGRVAWDHAGNDVDGASDVDGDGAIDLLIGAYIEDSGGINAGAAYLVRGPVSGAVYLINADAGFIGEAEGDLAGWSVAGLGDADGDGFGDLLIGAPQNDATGEDAGTVYFIRSTSF